MYMIMMYVYINYIFLYIHSLSCKLWFDYSAVEVVCVSPHQGVNKPVGENLDVHEW